MTATSRLIIFLKWKMTYIYAYGPPPCVHVRLVLSDWLRGRLRLNAFFLEEYFSIGIFSAMSFNAFGYIMMELVLLKLMRVVEVLLLGDRVT